MTTEKPNRIYDIVVIGAGIHGTSMACEAASRGLDTLLVQAGQVGGTASCMPSDLVGAGLHHLEHFQFPDLMTNIDELARLHVKAPHLVRPIPSYIIHEPNVRSRRKLQMGTSIYQRLQKRKHPLVPAKNNRPFLEMFAENAVFQNPISEYAVNYSRIVIALMQQLQEQNSSALLNHKLVDTRRNKDEWVMDIEDVTSGSRQTYRAKILINCTGCHSKDILKNTLGVKSRSSADALVSAHLFVELPQHWESAAIFQHPNKSLINAHSIDSEHLCVGPIVADGDEDADKEHAIDEFIALWNQKACVPISRDKIIHCRWYARPLAEDPSTGKLARSQETFLDLNNPGEAAPLLSLFGANFIQHRKVAQQGLDIIEAFTGAKRNESFINAPLPGGDFEGEPLESVVHQLCDHYAFLPPDLIQRLIYTYGTNALSILDDAHAEKDLGRHFGHGLYEREVDYLRANEWAETAEDILWRRTYLGLTMESDERDALNTYLKSH